MKKTDLFKTLTIIALFTIASISHLGFSTPSGQNWANEGGGYCQGTYTVYNNSIDKLLYAQNCNTGFNDVAAGSDFGALFNSVRTLMPHGGEIHLRNGFFAELTTAIFNTDCATLCETSLTLSGSGWGGGFNSGTTSTAGFNGTVIVAKTNAMTMVKATSSSASVTCNSSGCTGAPTIRGNLIRDMSFNANGLAAVGVDFRMAETATLNRMVDLRFSGNAKFSATPGFTTAMFLDGNEDTVVQLIGFDGDGSVGDSSAGTDLQWQVPLGNVEISQTFFGGVLNLKFWAQNIGISESTISSMKPLGTCLACGTVLAISNSYVANNQGGAGKIQLNGQTLGVVRISGSTVGCDNAGTGPVYSGTGTVLNAAFASDIWSFGTGCNWNSGGATLTKQVTDGANHVRINSGTPTNFPFTIDGNNNF